MPGDRKHHTAEFRSCVEKVMAKGESEDSAYAICTSSLQGAGKPIFEAAEENELETLGGPGSGYFNHAGRPGEVGGSAAGSSPIYTGYVTDKSPAKLAPKSAPKPKPTGYVTDASKSLTKTSAPKLTDGKDENTALLHGTAQGHLQSILKDGLKSTDVRQSFEGASEHGKVYMTTDVHEAETFGHVAGANQFDPTHDKFQKRVVGKTVEYVPSSEAKAWPAVIEIEIPEAERKRIESDPHYKGGKHFSYSGDIKPEWIKSVRVYDPKTSAWKTLTREEIGALRDAEERWTVYLPIILGITGDEEEMRTASDSKSESRQLHLLGATGIVRIEMLDNREHIVVPVVALMEGVIHAVNAATPEFVSAMTLQNAAASWNGKPVVLGHPVKNGKQCSANAPDVLASHGIGTIRNSRCEGTKLLQEAWIDKARILKFHPAMHDRLLAGQREEVSVGAYVVTDNIASTHNGKAYRASWRETAGDHLAFLPGGRGACSIEMGCGAHRAAAMRVCGDHLELDTKEIHMTTRTLRERFKALIAGFKTATNDDAPDETLLERYLATYEDCPECKGTGTVDGKDCEKCEGVGEMRTAIGARNSGADLQIIQDMHDRSVSLGAACSGAQKTETIVTAEAIVKPEAAEVLRVAAPLPEGLQLGTRKAKDCLACKGTGSLDGNPCEACDGNGKLKVAEETASQKLKRAAEMLAAVKQEANPDNIDIGDTTNMNAEQIAAEVDRVLLEKAAAGAASFKAACSCEESNMTPEAKVEIIKTLVEDKHSGFTKGDEKMLEAASDERLESFRVAAESRANQEKELKAAAEKKPTTEEFMAAAPPELRSLITRQQETETRTKAALVTELKAAQSEYSETELSVMDVDQLARMARVAKIDAAKYDYSGRGVPRAAAAQDDYTPPNPYDKHIEAMRSRSVN